MRKNIYICKECNKSHLAQHESNVTAPFMSSCTCGGMAQSTFYKLENIHKKSKAEKEFYYETTGDLDSFSERWLVDEI